jgi:hypothetical protein
MRVHEVGGESIAYSYHIHARGIGSSGTEAVVRIVIARSRATLARLVGSLQMVEG